MNMKNKCEICVPRDANVDNFIPDKFEFFIPVTESAKTRIAVEDESASDDMFPKRRKKRRSSSEVKQSRIYWNSETEAMIIEYKNCSCTKKRNKIYNQKLKFPFAKLVENVFNTFKFTYMESTSINSQNECISHLVANIDKFDEKIGKGKSFGYFSIVAKHFFILINNGNYKKWKVHASIENDKENSKEIAYEDNSVKNKENSEFIKMMVFYWEKCVGQIFNKKRDLDIAHAIIELFRKSDRIDCFNKKALYFYVREISNCKTQHITKVINKMKFAQKNISLDYKLNGKVENSKSSNEYDNADDIN